MEAALCLLVFLVFLFISNTALKNLISILYWIMHLKHVAFIK